jgi:hypothetical protein
MKLILHIGMGKTGSSAIQKALWESSSRLGEANAAYLGMWFDLIDPAFYELENQMRFYAQPADEMKDSARKLISVLYDLHEERGLQTFVISNEAMSGQSYALKPMLDVLVEAGVAVEIIGFVRNPYEWLPSAYMQWGIRDKVEPGNIKPYSVFARQLVLWYEGMLDWLRLHPGIVSIRSYDDSDDIVATFSKISGLPLVGSTERVFERGEDAEVLLRALFNNQFRGRVLPEKFDGSVFSSLTEIESIESSVSRYFDYSDTKKIIEENSGLFSALESELGFELCRESEFSLPDAERIRKRLVDALVALVLRQGCKIEAMEQRIAHIENMLRTHAPTIEVT